LVDDLFKTFDSLLWETFEKQICCSGLLALSDEFNLFFEVEKVGFFLWNCSTPSEVLLEESTFLGVSGD